MSYKLLKYLIYSDFFRISGKFSKYQLIRTFLFGEEFKYVFWMRVCSYLSQNIIFRFPFYYIAKGILKHYQHKFGISVKFTSQIGPGFYIGHFGSIHINKDVSIGKNCNISHEVTIGIKNRGLNVGIPTIGDNVYIGPGAKIFGNIEVGDNVAIGANSVVLKDVPNNAVVVGIPGKVISFDGSNSYVNHTDYLSFEEFK